MSEGEKDSQIWDVGQRERFCISSQHLAASRNLKFTRLCFTTLNLLEPFSQWHNGPVSVLLGRGGLLTHMERINCSFYLSLAYMNTLIIWLNNFVLHVQWNWLIYCFVFFCHQFMCHACAIRWTEVSKWIKTPWGYTMNQLNI